MSLLTGLLDVSMYGFTGAFVGFPSFVNPEEARPQPPPGLPPSPPAPALVVSFLTYFFGYSDADLESERAVKKVRLGKREPAAPDTLRRTHLRRTSAGAFADTMTARKEMGFAAGNDL